MAGLQILGHRQAERDSQILGTYTLDRRLYLDEDGDVVEEGDEDAAFLLGPKGAEIPMRDAVKLRLVSKDEAAASVAERLGIKVGKKPADKKGKKPADKAEGAEGAEGAGGED